MALTLRTPPCRELGFDLPILSAAIGSGAGPELVAAVSNAGGFGVLGAEDTVYTADLYDVGWPGAPHRTLRNKTFDEWDAAGRPASGTRPGEHTIIGVHRMASGELHEWQRYERGVPSPEFEGDLDYVPMWAGESCSVVNAVKPAAQIVTDLVRDVETPR